MSPLVPASSRSGSGGGALSTFQRIGPIGSSQAAFDFTSIPSSVNDVWITVNGRSDVAAQTQSSVGITLNGDTGANYLEENLQYQSSTLGVGGATGSTALTVLVPASSALANVAASFCLWLPNIQGTSFFKTMLVYNGQSWDATAPNQFIQMRTGTWRNTATVTRITLTATNWLTGSVATMYAVT